MRKLSKKYPEDDVAALLAKSMMNTMPWDYWVSGNVEKVDCWGDWCFRNSLATFTAAPIHHSFIYSCSRSFIDTWMCWKRRGYLVGIRETTDLALLDAKDYPATLLLQTADKLVQLNFLRHKEMLQKQFFLMKLCFYRTNYLSWSHHSGITLRNFVR